MHPQREWSVSVFVTKRELHLIPVGTLHRTFLDALKDLADIGRRLGLAPFQ